MNGGLKHWAIGSLDDRAIEKQESEGQGLETGEEARCWGLGAVAGLQIGDLRSQKIGDLRFQNIADLRLLKDKGI
jgi:hypothetical protein